MNNLIFSVSCQTTYGSLHSVHTQTCNNKQNMDEREAQTSTEMNYCDAIVPVDHGSKPTNLENETSTVKDNMISINNESSSYLEMEGRRMVTPPVKPHK